MGGAGDALVGCELGDSGATWVRPGSHETVSDAVPAPGRAWVYKIFAFVTYFDLRVSRLQNGNDGPFIGVLQGLKEITRRPHLQAGYPFSLNQDAIQRLGKEGGKAAGDVLLDCNASLAESHLRDH
ncbi:uncharacterized protein LOC144306623 [Canis aureus]